MVMVVEKRRVGWPFSGMELELLNILAGSERADTRAKERKRTEKESKPPTYMYKVYCLGYSCANAFAVLDLRVPDTGYRTPF